MREKQVNVISRLTLLVMLFASSISMSAMKPADSKVTIDFKSAAVPAVLQELKKQSGVNFFYSDELAKGWPRITVSARQKPVLEVVGQIAGLIGCSYKVSGNIVTFTKQAQSGRKRTIKGYVRDEAGEPLMGVPVCLGETQVCTVTDADGFYTFSIPVERTTLKFSYVGMKTHYEAIPQGSNAVTFDLAMTSDTQLGEVVVTGIFQKNKEAFTGAVTSISNKELKQYGNKNLLTSIANVDPSFNILVNNQFGSDPNHLPEVQLRGSTNLPTITDLQDQTKTDLNTPLIILDGFEITLTRMMDLNTEEVESITLLKDGSATAIYGSRGANGVIVITRRAPQAGKLQFTYTGSLNLEVPDLTGYHLLDAAQKLELERRAGYYDSTDPTRDFKLKQKYSSLLQQVERGVNTDWKSKPLRTGVGQRHSIRLEGGDDSFRYSVSLQYNDVKGVMKGSDRESFNGGITLSYSHRNFLFTNDLNIGHTKSDESPYGTFSDYTRLNPYWRAYDDDGNIIKMLDTDIDFFGGRSKLPGNPLYNAQLNQINSNKYTDITNNFSIEWRPFDGMITRGRVGLTWRDSETDNYKPAKHTMFEADEFQTAEGILRKGRYNYGTGKVTNYDIALTASYSKLFAKKHLLYTAANWNLRSDFSRTYSFAVEGFADETLDFLSSALQYQKGGKPSGSESKTHSVGLVLNANYSYDNRYYTDLAYRLDGSSQFGRNNRFAPFFSAGLGWNVHNEKFMKNVKFVNRLKVRGSFGQTGSQKFSAYQAVATYAYYLSDRYGQWVGAYQKALENPDLEWQKTDKWNVGVEMDLLDRRLSFTADLYRDKTSNLLSSLDLPLSNGFTSYIENIGEVENKGYELKATAFLVRNDARRLAWSVTGALIHNTDKVVKLSDAMKDEYTKRLLTNSTLPNKVIREGESQNTIYAVPSLGIDPSTGYELFLNKSGQVTYSWKASDRVACGLSEPKYRGTMSSMVRWKDFSATVSFGYRFGGQIYNSTLADRIENADKHYNVDERVFNDRWQKVGDHTLFKGLNDETTTYATTRFVQDERTLTCQNIHLSYMFTRNPWLMRNLGIQTMTLSSDLSDLFYISSVKQERGLSYPYSRRFSLSLTVTF